MARRASLTLTLLALVAVSFPLRSASVESVSPVAQARGHEPILLTGSQFPVWSAGPELSAREPGIPATSDCFDDHGDGLAHNCMESSRIPNNPLEGVPVDRLVGFRWDNGSASFVQVPFQVDERFTRYLSNYASNCNGAEGVCVGFGAYSAVDSQLTYAYERDAYRFTGGECFAEIEGDPEPEPDPVKGLDDNDELVFLHRDTGGAAPPGAPLPEGISELRGVRIDDVSAPDTAARFAYVGLAIENGARRAYDATNGYMRYTRDTDANKYEETSDNYGNAPRGPVCDGSGGVIESDVPRRPRDTAWVLTPRYAFRYDGRWILRGVRVNQDTDAGDRPLDSPGDYGPPLIDQWKARAYAQTPESETPCCGFQTEENDWGESSVTIGEKAGPVRVIRSTWGSNSGTNTTRDELLYPDMIVQHSYLRVHPIPPLGGIFSYWDHTAGVTTKYYNPLNEEPVAVDGRNDEEVFGTAYVEFKDGPGITIRDDDEIPVVGPQSVDLGDGDCTSECTDFDVTDPTHQGLVSALAWEQVGGQYGTMVFRTRFNRTGPGNVQGLASIPYYRDDSCFDDGTGIDPAPHRSRDTRPCWTPGEPAPDARFRQGALGSHGVQIMFAAETDNLALSAPVNELSAETRMVVLTGDPGNVGEAYSKGADIPLRATVADAPTVLTTDITVGGDTSGKIGDTASLQATLEDAVGPVADAPLDFTFQGRTYAATTDAAGTATVEVPVSGPAGTAELLVTFAGDSLRSPSFARSDFNVQKRSSSLSLEPGSDTSGKINHNAHLEATLSDSAGAVPGATLRFTFQGETYEATTAVDGVASIDALVRGPAGDTDVTVSFAGDATREGSSATNAFAVIPDDTSLSFEPASDTAGAINHDAYLEARLTDSAGPVAGAVVAFSFQGGTYEATTDDNGVASREVAIAGPTGETDLIVSFDGDQSRAATSSTTTFTVSKDDSSISFEPDSASSAKIGDEATFVAKLVDSAGPVAGEILAFDFQGATYEATTDDEGIASVSPRVSGPADDTPVSVSYAGDDLRGPSSASAAFTVSKRNSKISFTAKGGKKNTVVVKITLTDAEDGDGLIGRGVTVFVNDKHVASVQTGDGGKASASLRIANPKKKVFRVEFSQDSTHLGASAADKYGRNGAAGSS
ncbi:MAG: hypothetical protein WD826_03760 [Actinomycetota bacterium]